MHNDSTVEITPSLELKISGAAGSCVVRLDRISAQHLAAAMRQYSGCPIKNVDANLGRFSFVPATSAQPKAAKTSTGPVYLGRSRGRAVRL